MRHRRPGRGRTVQAWIGAGDSCFFCKEKVAAVDYKNIAQLRRFISERGKIKGRGYTGTCRKHQKQLAVSIKRAREMALLPYVGDSRERQTQPRSRYAE